MQKVYRRKVTSQWQVSIPKSLWGELGMTKDQRRILVHVDDTGIHLKPVPDFMRWAGAITPKKNSASKDKKGKNYPKRNNPRKK